MLELLNECCFGCNVRADCDVEAVTDQKLSCWRNVIFTCEDCIYRLALE
jgi:hypothetical protein